MSDGTQGEGWWQASDGKWYPPEQHPDFQPGATQPVESVPPPTAAMPAAPMPPPSGPPPGGPPAGPPPGAPGAGASNAKWIVVGVLAVAAVAIAAFLLFGGDDDKQNVAASSSSAPSSSSSSSSSKSSSSSSKSSSSTSSSSSTQVTEAELKTRLINAVDLGPDFVDETFTSGGTDPTPCGTPNVNTQVPPDIIVGSQASSGVASFEEQVHVYKSASDAKKALDAVKEGVGCPAPTIQGGGPAAFAGPNDVSADLAVTVEEAIAFDVQTEEAQGRLFFIRNGQAIVSFFFAAQKTADVSQLPNDLAIVNTGLNRLI
jgi:cytoskeletal protein RodZ